MEAWCDAMLDETYSDQKESALHWKTTLLRWINVMLDREALMEVWCDAMRDETCSDQKESGLRLGCKMPPPQMDRDRGAGKFQTCAAWYQATEKLAQLGPQAQSVSAALAHVLLTDEHALVRESAAFALGNLGTNQAYAALSVSQEHDEDPYVRDMAQHALKDFAPAYNREYLSRQLHELVLEFFEDNVDHLDDLPVAPCC